MIGLFSTHKRRVFHKVPSVRVPQYRSNRTTLSCQDARWSLSLSRKHTRTLTHKHTHTASACDCICIEATGPPPPPPPPLVEAPLVFLISTRNFFPSICVCERVCERVWECAWVNERESELVYVCVWWCVYLREAPLACWISARKFLPFNMCVCESVDEWCALTYIWI